MQSGTAQIKAARALLGISQNDLCRLAKITRPTLAAIETGTGDPKRSSIDKVLHALEREGVDFIENGVRLISK